MTGQSLVIRADANNLPLADRSVDLVVSSPPYFALRSYQDGGQHYAGQVGAEATPAEFIDALLSVTAECVRVLKPSGSIWVNLGDKYASYEGNRGAGRMQDNGPRGVKPSGTGLTGGGAVKAKSLFGLPWRYALGCIDQLGLILRAEVIWSKPNGLPESVTDRVRRSHEQWFHFQKQQSDDSGQVVEPGTQTFPLCSLCGRPADTRATLVARLHELDTRVQDCDLSDEVGPDKRVEQQSRGGSDEPGVVGLRGAPVPTAIEGDALVVEDACDLLDDSLVPVVDVDAQMGAAVPPVGERDAALSVDDAGQPGEVCSCRHPLIIDEEPWIPQQLAADLMQMVADGEADAQAVADYLSGDYARSHSTWFHFTKEPRYFSAVDEVREPHVTDPNVLARLVSIHSDPDGHNTQNRVAQGRHKMGTEHSLGKLPGSVWTVPTAPLKVPASLGVDHFAAFPPELVRRIISGWSPAGLCVECGQGRRPVVLRGPQPAEPTHRGGNRLDAGKAGNGTVGFRASKMSGQEWNAFRASNPDTITGYACDCPTPDAPTHPSVILDPFGGTGTTAMVARALGRIGISVDLSHDYSRLAQWRTNDAAQRAKVRGEDFRKPEPQVVGQADLFGGAA